MRTNWGAAWHNRRQLKSDACAEGFGLEGVADAVQFLANKIKSKSEKTVFDMIDVLSEGKMK